MLDNGELFTVTDACCGDFSCSVDRFQFTQKISTTNLACQPAWDISQLAGPIAVSLFARGRPSSRMAILMSANTDSLRMMRAPFPLRLPSQMVVTACAFLLRCSGLRAPPSISYKLSACLLEERICWTPRYRYLLHQPSQSSRGSRGNNMAGVVEFKGVVLSHGACLFEALGMVVFRCSS